MSTSPQDIQEAALALGLSIGPASCTASAADAAAHHRRRRDSPSSSSPRQSLTLSLSDDGLPAHKAEAEASPCSAASSRSMSGVKKEKDAEEAERVSSRGSDEEEDNSSGRKKLRLTKEQSAYLEDRFKEHSTLNPRQKQALAKQLNLRPRQVEVWFQNRRARTKLKQTEVDCELLKRYYEKLTSENQRLQKELQELKALKLAPAPSVYMQFPAATLTMCPSCERIGGGGAIDGGHPKVSSAGTVTGAAVVAPPKPSHFFNPFTHSATC